MNERVFLDSSWPIGQSSSALGESRDENSICTGCRCLTCNRAGRHQLLVTSVRRISVVGLLQGLQEGQGLRG